MMNFPVLIARLLRKKPLDTSASCASTSIHYETVGIAVTKTFNAPLTVGYFIAFAYAAILAPSTLPAVIFIACVTSLLSELCKYEFLTCKRGTSACPYICTYQLLGELPAYIHGWLQVVNKSVQVALIARGLGSVLVLILGDGLVRHQLIADYLVHEDTFGIGAQIVVTLFIMSGLQLTACLMTIIKVLIISAVLLFVSTTSYYCRSETEIPRADEDNSEKGEQFLMAAALMFIVFKPDNREPKLHSSARNVSIYVSVNHCTHLLLLIAMAVVVTLVSTSSLTSHEDSSPLLEVLIGLSSGSHWFIITFACLCILIGALSLVECIRDSSRHAIKMASDGLLFKQLAQDAPTASLATLLLSLAAEFLLSTFHLLCLTTFVCIALDSMIGIVVAYRRYCTSHSAHIPARWKNLRRRFNAYENPVDTDSSDSDDTDIDAAVDDYKTEVYVSTVMSWNGSEMMGRRNSVRTEQIKKSSPKLKFMMLTLFLLILVMSMLLRSIERMHMASIVVCAACFAVFLAILLVIWLHPQKGRAADVVFKVPCVPWIPIISSLFHFVLLFQLPVLTWAVAGFWIVAGLILYGLYGYQHSRLKMKNRFTKPNGNTTKRSRLNIGQFQIPGALLSVAANSVPVYPQAYHNLA